MTSYYIDSCIYLNLWKKEIDNSKAPLWKFAKNLFEKIDEDKSIIYYSGFLLKELMFILSTEEYLSKRELFEASFNFEKVFMSKEEYSSALNIKNKNNKTSLYDIIHMLLAKKTNSILVTRDKILIQLSKRYSVNVRRPEELL
ncbi:MAG: PIN domain-containing protein [Bacteroidetes bacterium]|nr:PIN domain-containing protein [Bacteroidota bacterium]